LRTVQLSLTVAHLKRLDEYVREGDSLTLEGIRSRLIEIQQRVWDELESRIFLAVELGDSKFFEDSQFHSSVLERFPEVVFDATEAGKCLAIERPTACAFHLMRVTEYGLKEIGKLLGSKDERPNWEPIILKIDAELKKPYKDRLVAEQKRTGLKDAAMTGGSFSTGHALEAHHQARLSDCMYYMPIATGET
jgi:hypothetical protein